MVSPSASGRFQSLIAGSTSTLQMAGLVLALSLGAAMLCAPRSAQAAPGAVAPSTSVLAGVTRASAPVPTPAVLENPAATASLTSHEAVYEMRLASVRSAAGIVGAGGTMHYTFKNSCDGWTVETQTNLTMLQTQGGPVQTSWDFLSWEGKDGKSYRFRVRNLRNGQVIETYDGEARLMDGGTGTAVFHLPDEDDQVFDLPAGTMFPTSHTQHLIDSARKGQHFISAPVFDGSAVQGSFLVSAAFGAGADKGPMAAAPAGQGTPANDNVAAAVDKALLQGEAWPMTLAFFDPDASGETPDFEVHLTYHANGIADQILQDFGDFSLRGTLIKLKSLPKPDC